MAEQKITADYCYINDAMGWPDGLYVADNYKVCNTKSICIKKRCEYATLRGECYKDADECSSRLYRDLLHIWNEDNSLKLDKFNLIDNKGVRLSCDYIGPSKAWAHYIGMKDKEIGEFLLGARTIGGHILWPVHCIPTINTARAGGASLFDRIDLALYEIRRFYLNEDRKSKFPQVLWSVLQKDIEKNFLLGFSGYKYGEDAFKAFVDFWLLQDFVVDYEKGDYSVVSLATSEDNMRNKVSENEPVFPGNNELFRYWKDIVAGNMPKEKKIVLCNAYKKYVKNLLCVIERRNERIIEREKQRDIKSST